MEPESDPRPPNPWRTVRRVLGALVLGIVAFAAFLFTACGVVFGIRGLLGGARNDLGLAMIAFACAAVGAAALYGLERLLRLL